MHPELLRALARERTAGFLRTAEEFRAAPRVERVPRGTRARWGRRRRPLLVPTPVCCS